jgi:virginiamycin B lyase
MHIRVALSLAVTGAFLLPPTSPEPVAAQAPPGGVDELKEWDVEWGGRSRDPDVAPDGTIWFVGQAGNYVARFDPSDETFRRYEIEDGANPHTVIVDDEGYGWYAGNRNGTIARVHPETGELTVFPTGEARDPHTMVFDGQGGIWFTSQQSNRVGRLDMTSGEVVILTPHASDRARPYGIVLDEEGHPWVSLFGADEIIRIHPETHEITRFKKASEASRSRRLEITGDGYAWYVDEPHGRLGRIEIATGEIREYAMPGGDGSRPYAITKDDRGVLWVSQTGPEKRLTAFDPRSESFVAVYEVSANIRHMAFDRDRGAMWFGTDANRIGRALTGAPHDGH